MVWGKLQKSNSVAENFFMLARHMVQSLDRKEHELWAITSWSLWNARNRFQFKHVHTHPSEIFKQADSLLKEYQRLAKFLPHKWNICLRIYPFYFYFLKFWCFWSNRSIVLWANFSTVKLLGQAFFCIFFWLIYFYHYFSQKTPLELVWMLLNQWIVISLQENNNNYSLIYVE